MFMHTCTKQFIIKNAVQFLGVRGRYFEHGDSFKNKVYNKFKEYLILFETFF